MEVNGDWGKAIRQVEPQVHIEEERFQKYLEKLKQEEEKEKLIQEEEKKSKELRQFIGGAVKFDPDPWKHRSSGMKCKTCIWFVPKNGDKPIDLGRCRRHAPTMSGYPAVFVNDWCGDHKLDENKI